MFSLLPDLRAAASLNAARPVAETQMFAARATLARPLALSLVLAASAWVAIPIGPVPVTLQTLAVVVLANLYGRRSAVAATLAYLTQGALGLPVFAQGAAGVACLVGPTGGYLLAFVAAAYLSGTLADTWGRGIWATALSMLAGHVVILAFGAAWLAQYVGYTNAVRFGIAPFVLDTLIKTIAGVLLATGLRRANVLS